MLEDPGDTNLRRVVRWTVVSIAGVSAIVAGVVLSRAALDAEGFVLEQLTTRIRAIVGLPLAVVVAFCVVSVLEAGSGPIEFKAIGFEFKGASGPIVLWIACFLAVISALWLLW
jgi:hypothetical protein